MIGRFAGFLLIVAAALTAVGAFPTWVTATPPGGGGGTGFNAFTASSDYRDAIVNFALAAALLLFGFALSVRPFLLSRLLGCLAGIAAAIWSGLIFFTFAPQARDLIGPSTNSALGSTTIGLGMWVTAGGAALGLLGGLIALAARRRVKTAAKTEEAWQRSALMGAPPAGPVAAQPSAPVPAPQPASTPVPAPTPASVPASTQVPVAPGRDLVGTPQPRPSGAVGGTQMPTGGVRR